MTSTASPTQRSGLLRAPQTLVAGLTVLVILGAYGLSLVVPGFYRMTDGEMGLLVVLAAAFAICDRLIFHIEARESAVSYSPTDIALAIGLVAVNPVGLVAVRVVGAALGALVWRRAPLYKTVFNLATFALETVMAVALFRAMTGVVPTSSIVMWIALMASIVFALMVQGVIIAAAISIFEGSFLQRARAEITSAPVFHLPGGVLAASVGVSVLLEPWMLIVALSPAPMLWFVVRVHGALVHRYSDLSNVYEFSRAVGVQADLRELATTAAAQFGEHLRAEHVFLRVWEPDGTAIDIGFGDEAVGGLACDRATAEAWDADTAHRPTWFDLDDVALDVAAPLESLLLDGAFVTQLADERGPLGVLVLAGRQGVQRDFDADDRSRLEGLAQQFSVALRKAQFHSQIQYEATHDSLTSLPNRRYFEAWVEQSLAGRSTTEAAVLLIDLDGFKEINDAFGLPVGDKVLREVAMRLTAGVPDDHVVARFTADEFAVFAPGQIDKDAIVLAESLCTSLEQTFVLDEGAIAIGASIGVAASPEHGREASVLVRHADIAMSDAKQRRARVSGFRDDLDGNDSVRVALLADLRTALADNVLDVHYQPKVEPKTGQIIAAEALVRWDHPERGFVSPELFVGLAEQAGLIEALTERVLSLALSAAAEWERRGWDIGVAVNISAQSLQDDNLPTIVAEQLRRSGLAAGRLTLEITESTMMGDLENTHRILGRLSDLGLELSVDDYGTGFSSLVNLRHLPVSELKIDRSFVSEMAVKASDEVIVRSTIDLGHNLGLVVVAEGVEDGETLRQLADLGVDLVQGYCVSRPLPIDKFVHWVQDVHAAALLDEPDPELLSGLEWLLELPDATSA